MNDQPSPAPWHSRARKTFAIARGLTLAAIGAHVGGVMIYVAWLVLALLAPLLEIAAFALLFATM